MIRKTWTKEEKARALGLYIERGIGFASDETGVPRGTIASWAHRDPELQTLQRETRREQTAVAVEAHQEAAAIRWAEAKAELVPGLAGFAISALQVAHDAMEDGDMRTAKDAMLSLAIASDKAQLLSGGATGRLETSDTSKLLADGRTRVMRLIKDEETPLAETG